MQCPRCDTSLAEGQYEQVVAFLCQSCAGILIKQRDLPSVLDRLSLDLYASVSISMNLPVVPDINNVIDCPECRSKMEHYGYMGSHKVMIDCCASCNWLWLDALELSAMAKMYVRTDKSRERSLSLYKTSDIVGTHMITEAVSKAFLMGFVFF